MGPSGKTILLVLATAVGAIWIFTHRPRQVIAAPLPRLTADGVPTGETRSADRCVGARGCLIVYVAPWCGPCNQSLPHDRALADLVKGRGIETTFVVGMDTLPKCQEMARAIGREVLVDEEGTWARKMGIQGVPHFLVTGTDGKVRKRQAGALLGAPEEFARRLGL
jgi:predicted regulator of Ras-like GTPase activity (Roadblock/LC7/MglB family)